MELFEKALVFDRCYRDDATSLLSAKARRLVVEVEAPEDERLTRWLLKKRLFWALMDAKSSTSCLVEEEEEVEVVS